MDLGSFCRSCHVRGLRRRRECPEFVVLHRTLRVTTVICQCLDGQSSPKFQILSWANSIGTDRFCNGVIEVMGVQAVIECLQLDERIPVALLGKDAGETIV